MIMDRWNQMKTDFDLQLYIASFGPEVWIFPMFQIEIWQMAGSFWLFKSPLHFHFKLYKISEFKLLNKFFLILLLAPDRQSYNNPTILHNNHTQQEAGYYMVEMDLIWWGFRSAHTCECSPSFSTTRHFCYITRWPQNFKYLNAVPLSWEKLKPEDWKATGRGSQITEGHKFLKFEEWRDPGAAPVSSQPALESLISKQQQGGLNLYTQPSHWKRV